MSSNVKAAWITGLLALLGSVIAVYFAYWRGPDQTKYLNGTVTGAKAVPLPNVELRLESPETNFFRNTTTDQTGRYRLELPKGIDHVTIKARLDGYKPYNVSVPTVSPNDISLERLLNTIGFPDGFSLESNLKVLEKQFGIKIPFSNSCPAGAKKVKVTGFQTEVDPDKFEGLIEEVLARTEASRWHYGVNVLEKGKRYEITCV